MNNPSRRQLQERSSTSPGRARFLTLRLGLRARSASPWRRPIAPDRQARPSPGQTDVVPVPGRAAGIQAESNVRLLPLTDHIGDMVIYHGERGTEIDPVHPLACLCGQPYYLHCEHWMDWLDGLTLYPKGDQP